MCKIKELKCLRMHFVKWKRGLKNLQKSKQLISHQVNKEMPQRQRTAQTSWLSIRDVTRRMKLLYGRMDEWMNRSTGTVDWNWTNGRMNCFTGWMDGRTKEWPALGIPIFTSSFRQSNNSIWMGSSKRLLLPIPILSDIIGPSRIKAHISFISFSVFQFGHGIIVETRAINWSITNRWYYASIVIF